MMRRLLFAFAALVVPLSSQAQFTITFEGTDQLATHGLVASNLYVRDVTLESPNPYVAWANAPVSGTHVTGNLAVSWFPTNIQRVDGGLFTFNSGYFTSILASSEAMYFRGYRTYEAYQHSRDFISIRDWDLNDGTFYALAGIGASGPTFVSLNWAGLAVLELGSTGGEPLDPMGFSGDNFEGFAGDDLRFDYVAPEPTSLVLVATGLVLLAGIGNHLSRRGGEGLEEQG